MCFASKPMEPPRPTRSAIRLQSFSGLLPSASHLPDVNCLPLRHASPYNAVR